MKCPERFRVSQLNIRKSIKNDYEEAIGEFHLLIENQDFVECYKEECTAYDKENKKCRKLG